MTKILITGSNGLIGQKISEQLLTMEDLGFLATSYSANKLPAVRNNFELLDITQAAQVKQMVADFNPDIIINCAGMTQVDPCEEDQKACWEVNTEAVNHLIDAANSSGARLVQLSTDFVFSGNTGLYSETDIPGPISFYGLSNWEAEQRIQTHCTNFAIVRTVLVYGVTALKSRSNLVLWVKESLENGQSIRVVDDQFRTPTLAEDVAWGTIALALCNHQGIYHISGDEYMSVFEIAQRTAEFFNLDKNLIEPVASLTLNQKGKRPPKTGFNITKARTDLKYCPHSLEQGLSVIKKQLDLV